MLLIPCLVGYVKSITIIEIIGANGKKTKQARVSIDISDSMIYFLFSDTVKLHYYYTIGKGLNAIILK